MCPDPGDQQEPEPTGGPSGTPGDSLNQEELDRLLREAADPASPLHSQEHLGETNYLDEDAILGDEPEPQTEITPESPASAVAPAPSDDVEEIDQAMIDSLLARLPAQTESPGETSAPLDTPPAPSPDPETPPPVVDDALNQSSIDALLAQAPRAPAPEPAESLVDQAAIDALLAAPAAADIESPQESPHATEPSAPAPPASPPVEEVAEAKTDEVLSQAEIERLLAGALPAQSDDVPVMLDQSELDALVAGMSEDSPLVPVDQDAALASAQLQEGEAVSLAEENVESLLGGLGLASAPLPVPDMPGPASPPAPSPAPVAAPDLSQSMIDALIAAASGESSPASAVGSENLAAAATAPAQHSAALATAATAASETAPAAEEVNLLSQDDLDKLIEESKRRDRERNRIKQEMLERATSAPPEESAPLRRIPRSDSHLLRYLRANGARVAASFAAGLLVTTGVYLYLVSSQLNVPDPAALALRRGNELEEAVATAQRLIAEGDYRRAVDTLRDPIAAAPASRERTDAQFLLTEGRYKSIAPDAPLAAYDEVQTEIDSLVAQAPGHPRIAEAVEWKALLYLRSGLPFAALDAYDTIVERYAETAVLDRTLIEATRLALELGRPDRAARYSDRLLQQFPNSDWGAEAKLLQGDAYAKAGQREAARQRYTESYDEADGASVQAEAVLRLGQLAFEEGDYEQAIRQLRGYLAESTTASGNDKAYLLLAKALRKAGKDAEASSALNDLLRFFPETGVTPEAYIELSQLLDLAGDRAAAIELAQEAERKYPRNPIILRGLGEMLGLSGNPFSAATALAEADEAGANDPSLLLTAARHYKTAGVLDLANQTYLALINRYAGSPESLVAGVERAELIYERGDARRALTLLEEISLATEGTARQMPALLAMARIYQEVGLADRLAAVSRQIAGQTDDPAHLSRAATALLRTGDVTAGKAIVDRLDIQQLPDTEAYALLTALGNALMSLDPPRGMARLEEAYLNYPSERRAEDSLALLEGYLDDERPAAARRIVLDMTEHARRAPEDAPTLIDAAIAWGDYLYDKSDYRAAADAYALVEGLASDSPTMQVDGNRRDRRWATYQRANALLKLADYDGSIALLEEIAKTDAPWAREAATKAEYARLELKMRRAPTGAPPARAASASQPAPAREG